MMMIIFILRDCSTCKDHVLIIFAIGVIILVDMITNGVFTGTD